MAMESIRQALAGLSRIPGAQQQATAASGAWAPSSRLHIHCLSLLWSPTLNTHLFHQNGLPLVSLMSAPSSSSTQVYQQESQV